jgi:hypothetical protein
MKKPIKKAMGGKTPAPRPVGGGMSRPSMPGKKPERPIQMGPGFPGGKPIPVPAKPGMPMRRAKGGMAKGKK